MDILFEEARLVAMKDNEQLGEMTFVVANNIYIIDHTGVNDTARGLGVGQSLVSAFVEHAREVDRKILPLCPFAKAQFDKNSDYTDVLFGN